MPRRCPCTAGWAAPLALLAAMAATRRAGADGWWSPQSAAAAVTGVGALLSCSALPTRGGSAGRARVLGALLAFPQLAAAQAPYVMTDSNIGTAVRAWLSNSASAEATYGHISTWDTSGVTDMEYLFSTSRNSAASSFNDDIGAWDTSGVTTMRSMFYYASAFNRDISGWAVDSVTTMYYMFCLLYTSPSPRDS